ncbi:MAG TPA: hypothetical protein VGG34_01260 [Opitutaceae bacterium]|jgi:hypothetical protein
MERESDDVSDLSAEDLKDVLEFDGDAQLLAKALKDCGFISEDGQTAVGWNERYGAKLALYRNRAKQAAEARWSLNRETKTETRLDIDKTRKHPEASSKDASSILQAEKANYAPTGAASVGAEIPLELRTPEFEKAWESWRQHRIEIKKPLKPTSESQGLKWCVGIGLARAIRAIEFTIFKGWQGLREPEGTDLPQKPSQPADPYRRV